MLTNQTTVLRTLLECGIDDLYVLDDIRYDLGDIIDELLFMDIKPTLNAIIGEVFRKGAEQIEQCVNDRISELKEMSNGQNFNKEKEDELVKLKMLYPQEDIEWYCNCQDASIYFRNNEDIYRLYFTCEIESVEENMGFSF